MNLEFRIIIVMLNLVQHLLYFTIKYRFMKQIIDPETSSG
jgi:hypothetical protein